MRIAADLHIHSCLSPCGSLEMGPEAVIAKAIEKNLTHIAIADHNSTQNIRAFCSVAQRHGIYCIPAIEVTSAEEAHILCYFDSIENAEDFGSIIENSLLPIPLDPEKMGDQIVVNAEEEIINMPETYLGVASGFTISEIVSFAVEWGGCIVPAHVDKPLFSVISQLGFLPAEPFTAVEISAGAVRQGKVMPYGAIPTLSSSDSHYLDTIGSVFVECESTGEITNASDLFSLFIQATVTLKY